MKGLPCMYECSRHTKHHILSSDQAHLDVCPIACCPVALDWQQWLQQRGVSCQVHTSLKHHDSLISMTSTQLEMQVCILSLI